ncbi:uncharacterized protein LOC133845669 [Drosophila sulfurigaster albostrigata]|uniref:uncharacterized protein LOC133845669 n=1 Tax=Drosophila sulfurigaster albostrigata TaxID=89887 RepID=UPI002D21A2E2|nr:uncharacterized protein LOC133845669 [Drosophila sulfurigaster albostrigata]
MRVLLITLLLSGFVLPERRYRFTNIKCNVLDKSYTSFAQCKLKVVGRGIIALTVEAKLLKGPFYNAKVNLSLWRKYSEFRPFIFNSSLDFCKAMACTNSTLSFHRIIYRAVLKYSNLNQTCPYDKEIYIRNWVLKEEQLKLLPLPSGEYQIKVMAFTDNECKAIVYINFSVKEDLMQS